MLTSSAGMNWTWYLEVSFKGFPDVLANNPEKAMQFAKSVTIESHYRIHKSEDTTPDCEWEYFLIEDSQRVVCAVTLWKRDGTYSKTYAVENRQSVFSYKDVPDPA